MSISPKLAQILLARKLFPVRSNAADSLTEMDCDLNPEALNRVRQIYHGQ
jgi:hypothetical protein